ncbi:hypothetical protein GALL_484310 [mine drainage metagenome]|uniref:Uncharacterized protein n=1 Tax=mine drainage metagenome TaxID=410659 RepID=A0A1J5PQW7_9ZZZZ
MKCNQPQKNQFANFLVIKSGIFNPRGRNEPCQGARGGDFIVTAKPRANLQRQEEQQSKYRKGSGRVVSDAVLRVGSSAQVLKQLIWPVKKGSKT